MGCLRENIKMTKTKHEKLLTIRDTAALLGISEKDVMNLAESGAIPAYKVGGVYLRFKYDQVEQFKQKRGKEAQQYSAIERIRDFLYFNDFYILSGLIIIFILTIIFRG